MSRLGRSAAVVALTAALLAVPGVAVADDLDPDHLPTPSAADLEASVSTLHLDGTVAVLHLDHLVEVLHLDDLIKPLVVTETKDEQTVVTISADLLFAFGSAQIDAGGIASIQKAVTPAPQGAAIAVTGYTDAIGGDAINLPLSLARAQAVAAVISAARPDLVVKADGLGSANPIAPEVGADGKDDPAGRAVNRRVEIRFTG